MPINSFFISIRLHDLEWRDDVMRESVTSSSYSKYYCSTFHEKELSNFVCSNTSSSQYYVRALYSGSSMMRTMHRLIPHKINKGAHVSFSTLFTLIIARSYKRSLLHTLGCIQRNFVHRAKHYLWTHCIMLVSVWISITFLRWWHQAVAGKHLSPCRWQNIMCTFSMTFWRTIVYNSMHKSQCIYFPDYKYITTCNFVC